METDINIVLSKLQPYLDWLDAILRHGHSVFERYPPDIVVDFDPSAQAHCTNRHILAEARRILNGMPYVRHLEIRGQNLWLFEDAHAVVRFKKTDEDGVSSNYPTSQAKAFDDGDDLPGLPQAPTRLTAGYLLDPTGIGYVRSQVSLQTSKGAMWCAAIIPPEVRKAGDAVWHEITKQHRLI